MLVNLEENIEFDAERSYKLMVKPNKKKMPEKQNYK